MSTTVTDVAIVGAFAAAGLVLLVIGASWIRLLRYRITATHLEVLALGLPVRRVALSRLDVAALVDRGGSGPSCLWFYVWATLQPWRLPPWRFERWGNRFCGPYVLVRRSRGRTLVLTPDAPGRFVKELNSAIARARTSA